MPEEFLHAGPPKTWPQIQVLRRVWLVAARLRDLHEVHFKRIDMPMLEFDLLASLGNTSGKRMKDLAETMITTPSNVTRVCTVMEEKGLVERQRSSESDREVIARLTPRGEKLFREVFPKTVNYGARLMDTGLTRPELETLAALLEKLAKSVTTPP